MVDQDLGNLEWKALEINLRNREQERDKVPPNYLLGMKWSYLIHFAMLIIKCESLAQTSLLRSRPISSHLVNVSTQRSLRFLKLSFSQIKHGNSMDSQASLLILHSSPMSNQSPHPTNSLFSMSAIGSTGLSSLHMHYFSILTVTNHCKIKGLIGYTQLILQFYRLKIQHQSH